MPRHLLALRFSSLGDVVLLSGPLAWLRSQQPQLRLSVATKAAYAPLLEGQPWVDEVWTLEEEGLLGLARRARREGVDALADLHGNFRSRVVSLASAAPVNHIRNHRLDRHLLLKRGLVHIVPAGTFWATPPHVASRYAQALAEATGLTPPSEAPAPNFKISAEASQKAYAQAPGAGPWIGVVPGAAWATKRWPLRHFASALDALARQGPLRFMLFGSESERGVCQEVIASSGEAKARCVDLSGQTPLPLLAAQLGRCQVVLSNDSGPMHLAGAVGAKVVAFFGPTVEGFGFTPLGSGAKVLQKELPCRPCSLHGGDICPLGTH